MGRLLASISPRCPKPSGTYLRTRVRGSLIGWLQHILTQKVRVAAVPRHLRQQQKKHVASTSNRRFLRRRRLLRCCTMPFRPAAIPAALHPSLPKHPPGRLGFSHHAHVTACVQAQITFPTVQCTINTLHNVTGGSCEGAASSGVLRKLCIRVHCSFTLPTRIATQFCFVRTHRR